MIIKESQQKVSISGTKVGITQEGLEHLIRQVGTLYRDTRTFILEMICNALDAHTVSGITRNIEVKLEKDINGRFIFKVKDYGGGMSPAVINDVFAMVGESTKRDSNDPIGGFGVAKVSPFAYTNQYEIVTNSGGICYTYLFFLGKEGNPEIKLLHSKKSSEIGTEIIVHMNKDEQVYDVFSFLIKRCKFLTGIDYLGELKFFGTILEDYPDFVAWKHKDVTKFRNSYLINNTYNSQEIEVSLGGVSYELDWNLLERDPIELPIGIKFKVGELPIPMTRESITYTSEAKKLINERIDKSLNYIKDKFKKSIKKLDLAGWFQLNKNGKFIKSKVNLNLNHLTNINEVIFKDLPISYNPRNYYELFPFKVTHYFENGVCIPNTGRSWFKQNKSKNKLTLENKDRFLMCERNDSVKNRYLASLKKDFILVKWDADKIPRLKESERKLYIEFCKKEYKSLKKYKDIEVPKEKRELKGSYLVARASMHDYRETFYDKKDISLNRPFVKGVFNNNIRCLLQDKIPLVKETSRNKKLLSKGMSYKEFYVSKHFRYFATLVRIGDMIDIEGYEKVMLQIKYLNPSLFKKMKKYFKYKPIYLEMSYKKRVYAAMNGKWGKSYKDIIEIERIVNILKYEVNNSFSSNYGQIRCKKSLITYIKDNNIFKLNPEHEKGYKRRKRLLRSTC